MLQHTFIHLPRIGGPSERRIWQAGLTTWQQAVDAPADAFRRAGVGPGRADSVRAAIDESIRRWAVGDIAYLAGQLPPAETWRLFGELHRDACYLDIETTGGADVTAVVVHRAGQTMFFVRDQNLHELPIHLAGVKLLVTYNGRCFDWPVLQAAFARLPAPAAHFDLRYPFARLRYRGGLKGIEKAIGLARPAELAEVDGASAVWLWHRHNEGDRRALPALLRYCAEDVLNLKYLAEWVHNALAGPLPVGARLFAQPARAECDSLPAADADLMADCRRSLAAMREFF